MYRNRCAEDLIEKGRTWLKMVDPAVSRMLQLVQLVKFNPPDGVEFMPFIDTEQLNEPGVYPCVNAPVFIDDVFERLLSWPEVRKSAAVAYYDTDGWREWVIRSREGGLDVSAIAKKMGGEGWRHRAWFSQRRMCAGAVAAAAAAAAERSA